jgi:hypothetical protein
LSRSKNVEHHRENASQEHKSEEDYETLKDLMVTSQDYLPLRSSHQMEMETIRVNMTVRKPINPNVGRQARVVIYRAIPV